MRRHTNDPTQVSRYTPLWESLKTDGKLSLLVLPQLKNRIIKAIRKKRDTDLGFRYSLAEKEMRAQILWSYKGNTLNAELVYTKILSLNDL